MLAPGHAADIGWDRSSTACYMFNNTFTGVKLHALLQLTELIQVLLQNLSSW